MTKAEMLVIAEHAENYPAGYGYVFFAIDTERIDTAGEGDEELRREPDLLVCV